jgi:hypothetical protein
MGSIANLLDELAARRECLAGLEAEIAAAIPAHLLRQKTALETEVKNLEAGVKEKAKYIPETQAHTVIGRLLQLVWTPGRVSWDGLALEKLAGEFGIPESRLVQCRTQGDGFWSIRKAGKK